MDDNHNNNDKKEEEPCNGFCMYVASSEHDIEKLIIKHSFEANAHHQTYEPITDDTESNDDHMDIGKSRRILSNREAARRSRKRKQAHLTALEEHVEHLRRETLPILETLRAKIKVAEDLVASHSSSSSLLSFEQQVEQLRGDYEALRTKNIINHNDKMEEEAPCNDSSMTKTSSEHDIEESTNQTFEADADHQTHEPITNTTESNERNDDEMNIRKIRRMLSNRESARRSRKRKQAHLTNLQQQAEQMRRETLSTLETLRAKVKEAEDLVARHSLASSDFVHNKNGFEQKVEQLRGDYEALRAKVNPTEDMVASGSLTSSFSYNIDNNSGSWVPPWSTCSWSARERLNYNNLDGC